MFKDVKLGDKVWDFIYGWGEVTSTCYDLPHYPFLVKFPNNSDSYTADGKFRSADPKPRLFWDEIEFKVPKKPLPNLAIDTKVSESLLTGINPAVKETNPKSLASSNKAPMAVVPANVLMEISVALMEGALKYGRHNYRASGVKASEYYSATLRHLMYWWEGEDADADALGLSHITKAISSLIIIRDAMMRDQLNDDRPPKSNMPDFQEHIKKLKEKYKDFDPKHYTELNKNEQE